jgi:magnesium-transporting ATPase (P-type)
VLGLVLLGWLFSLMRSTGWEVDPVMHLLAWYGVVQMMPFVLVSLIGAWVKRKALMRAPPERKRTASLQRRGLFDVVSPFTVFLAVLAYLLFAAFMITIQQHPIAGFAGYFFLRTITMVCALNAFVVYWLLYGRKRWTLETRAYRAQAVEVQVKIVFYVSIAAIVFISLLTTLRLLNLRGWMPFAMSVYFVIIMLFTSMMLFALRRQAEADRPQPGFD